MVIHVTIYKVKNICVFRCKKEDKKFKFLGYSLTSTFNSHGHPSAERYKINLSIQRQNKPHVCKMFLTSLEDLRQRSAKPILNEISEHGASN